jgi:uncharacterized protein YodC (DUF2158 family)
MPQFKPGDIVMLKSGGPTMIVSRVLDDAVVCEWFDSKQTPHIREFVPETIEIYTGPTIG